MISKQQIDDAVALVKRRNRILVDLDIAGFKAMCLELGAVAEAVELMSDEVAICAMHKSRVDITAIPRYLRLESVEWLRARGYTLYKGGPLPPSGVSSLHVADNYAWSQTKVKPVGRRRDYVLTAAWGSEKKHYLFSRWINDAERDMLRRAISAAGLANDGEAAFCFSVFEHAGKIYHLNCPLGPLGSVFHGNCSLLSEVELAS